MTETSVATGRCVIYTYDTANKSWTPTVVTGFSRIDLYHNTSTGTYRVIGRGLEDASKIVINSNFTADMSYSKASETFHQWNDKKTTWGLNFGSADESTKFFDGVTKAQNQLKNPTPAAPAAPSAPTPPAAPAAPKAPPAPKAPAAPKPSGGGGSGRGALLDSIQGFKKGGLKKAETVDKSGPVGVGGGGGGAPSGGGGGAPPMGGGGGDMMAEMMRKRNAMKSSEPATPPAAAPKPEPPKVASEPPKVSPTPPGGAPNLAKKFGAPPAVGKKFGAPPPVGGPPKAYGGAPSSTPTPGGGGGNLSPEMQNLKDAIMSEVRSELEQMKNDIINALK